jgi:transposase
MIKPTHNKHTMKNELLFVGLDVHAQSIAIALAEGGGGEARTYGSIPNDLHALEKVFGKLRKAHPGTELRVCYEAGPTGFVIARRCAQLKIACTVVAPSLIPSRSGDRVKTDRRDALKLARLHRAGELTAVHVPDANDEAMRDLCRARTDAVQDLRRGRAQLKAFLLRNGYRYTGKSAWTEAHRRYLRELVLPHPAQRVVLEDAIATIGTAEERIGRLEEQMHALLESWPMKPVVEAVMGMRGFAVVGAMVLVSELGGAWRFDHPRQLMAYLGLVPTENTSDQKRRQGGITKTGNGHARWLLIEAAHHYRLSPKVSKELSARQQGLSQEIKACSWKAQTRLHKRMRQLLARGKQRNKVTVAVARELCGFVWQIFRLMEPHMSPPHAATV